MSILQTNSSSRSGNDRLNALLVRSTLGTNRSTFLRRSAATLFALFAGATVGVRPAFADPTCTQCCSGPFGSGYCGESNCNGNQCAGICGNVTGYCQSGGSCWGFFCLGAYRSCCDCACSAGVHIVYCFCCGDQ
jgi:hypothetical protein